jgi:aspartate carbamoyltransferase
VSVRNHCAPAAIAGNFAGKHVVTVEQFARADLQLVFDAATALRERVRDSDRTLLDVCAGKVLATLFYEASTRTDMSFQAAMHRLGGQVIATSGGVQFSSVYKGENLADTVRAVGCYADVIVLRHPDVGSSYEAACYLDRLSGHLARRPVIISGGDGIGEHPTQALLDMFTIIDFKERVDYLKIAMVGDLLNGRTVHSLAKLIALYGAVGTTLSFVAPPSLRMPTAILDFLNQRGIGVYETDNLYDVLGESDVIYWTRIQEERFENRADYEAIADRFIMLPEMLAQAKTDAILMHPLPRKHEMGTQSDHDVLDADPRSVYFRQMENGMFVRMALLAKTLGAHGV